MYFSPLAVLLLAPLGTMASQVNLNVYSFFTTYIPLAFLALSIKAPLSSAKTYNRPSADSSFDTPQPTTTTNCQQYAGSAYPSLGQTVGGPYGSQSMLWVSATDRCYDTCGRKYRISFFFFICIPSSSASVSLRFPPLFVVRNTANELFCKNPACSASEQGARQRRLGAGGLWVLVGGGKRILCIWSMLCMYVCMYVSSWNLLG